MTSDKMIEELKVIRDEIGGDHEVAVVGIGFGENDYLIPNYAIYGDFIDQDYNKFKCAFIAKTGGEEFTTKGIPHYKWEPKNYHT